MAYNYTHSSKNSFISLGQEMNLFSRKMEWIVRVEDTQTQESQKWAFTGQNAAIARYNEECMKDASRYNVKNKRAV